MNNTNTLISGDNKGYASYLFEKRINGESSLPGKLGGFVAAFAQSNEGDVSPNTMGPSCPDGCPCEEVHSTCNGTNEGCIGKGPGRTMEESTEIIGSQQFKKAFLLWEAASKTMETDSLDFIHTFVDMSNLTVSSEFSSTGRDERTCPGALGVSYVFSNIRLSNLIDSLLEQLMGPENLILFKIPTLHLKKILFGRF
jgi:neutral ceramidase